MQNPSRRSSTSFMKAQLVGNSQDLQSRFIFCDINGCYVGSTTLRATTRAKLNSEDLFLRVGRGNFQHRMQLLRRAVQECLRLYQEGR